jgi:hypothetical protein
MTVADFLAMPVGTSFYWDMQETSGHVAGRDGSKFLIVWADGQDTIVEPDDEDLHELAGNCELIGSDPDSPHVVEGQAQPTLHR